MIDFSSFSYAVLEKLSEEEKNSEEVNKILDLSNSRTNRLALEG